MLGNGFDRHRLPITPTIGKSNRARGTMTKRPAAGRVEELILRVNELRGTGVRETDRVLRSAVCRQSKFDWLERTIINT